MDLPVCLGGRNGDYGKVWEGERWKHCTTDILGGLFVWFQDDSTICRFSLVGNVESFVTS